MNNSIKKGDSGYLDSQHTSALIRAGIFGVITLILGLCTWVIFPQYGMVFLVLAVISAIPTAMALVNFIMFMRFKSIGEEDHAAIEAVKGKIPVIYDSVITTTEKSYYCPSISVINKNIMLYTNAEGSDEKALIRHLTLMAKKNGFKDWHIKAYKDTEGYIKRLSYLNDQNIKVLKTDEDMVILLKNLSL